MTMKITDKEKKELNYYIDVFSCAKSELELYCYYYSFESLFGEKHANKIFKEAVINYFNNDKIKIDNFYSTKFKRFEKEVNSLKHENLVNDIFHKVVCSISDCP